MQSQPTRDPGGQSPGAQSKDTYPGDNISTLKQSTFPDLTPTGSWHPDEMPGPDDSCCGVEDQGVHISPSVGEGLWQLA